MRDGREISDSAPLESFDSQVETVNSAIDAANLAVQSLDADQRLCIHWVCLVERSRR